MPVHILFHFLLNHILKQAKTCLDASTSAFSFFFKNLLYAWFLNQGQKKMHAILLDRNNLRLASKKREHLINANRVCTMKTMPKPID